jgi:phage-related baseplate assembly protein
MEGGQGMTAPRLEELVLLSLASVEKANNQMVVNRGSTIDMTRPLSERLAARSADLAEAQVYATLAQALANDTPKTVHVSGGRHHLNTHNTGY